MTVLSLPNPSCSTIGRPQAYTDLLPLAPLHQLHNLLGMRAARRAFPEAAQVACFDTTFHRAHPWVNDTYALPRELYEQGILHYGAVRGGVRITDHSVNFDSNQCAAI